MKASAFRGNDIRGIYGDEVTEELAMKVGYVAPSLLGATSVFIARDGRSSSDSLHDALLSGLRAAGVQVVDGGLMDTCQFYFSCWKGSFDAGFMITASHNPAEYNGIKFVKENAYPITLKDLLGDIRDAAMESNSPAEASSDFSYKVGRHTHDYVSHILEKAGQPSFSSLKVVVDASGGMGGLLFPQVFANLGLDLQLLNFATDAQFSAHNPNPQSSEACKQLQEAVVSSGADIGIIFDGDADRVMFCDEKGEMLRGDIALALLSRERLEKDPGSKVICDIRSSDFVRDIVEGHGGTLVEAPVGHSFIVQEMAAKDVSFGAEVSGHVYYRDGELIADNAMLAALEMLQLLSGSEKALSELWHAADTYATISEKNFKDIDVDASIEAIRSALVEDAVEELHIDGLSLRFSDWKMNLRSSNTEPLVRLMIESHSKALLDEKLALIESLIVR